MSHNLDQSAQPNAETTRCQFCGQSTPNKYNFCVQCKQQTKCLECKSELVPGADFCFVCTKPIFVRPVANQAPNQYEREAKKEGDNYEEKIKFALSDNSVVAIAPFIIGQIMPDANALTLAPPPSSLPEATTEDTSFVDVTGKKESSAGTSSETAGANGSVDSAPPAPEPTKADSSLRRFFRQDGNLLIPIRNDFKGKSWSEQQRNFVLVYAKAHQDILGKGVPDKNQFKLSGTKLSLIDIRNFPTYLSKVMVSSFVEIGGCFELNESGEAEVIKIVNLMLDEKSEPGFAYWSRTPSTSSLQRSRLSQGEKSKAEKWAGESVDLGSLNIIDVSGARDYALVAVWLLIYHLKKAETIKWNEAHIYLTTKFPATSVTGQAFSKAMALKDNEKFFTKSGEGAFYLTSAGKQLVEDWVSGKTKIKQQASNS